MSDETDKESKTEEPTEKRVRESLDRGEAPISRDLVAAAAILGAASALAVFSRARDYGFVTNLAAMLDRAGDTRLLSGADAGDITLAMAGAVARALGAVLAIAMACGLLGSLAQKRPRIAAHNIAPKLNRIAPGRALARMVGKRGAIEFGKALIRTGVCAACCAVALFDARALILEAPFRDPVEFAGGLVSAVVHLFTVAGVCVLAIGIGDLLLARLEWRKGLRMTRQETKEEMRQAEGDPLVKGRLKSLAMQRARRRMMADVQKATVVIANPTHYAIALRYVPSESGAPMVVAKGRDLVALRIRERAEALDIPVIENPPLARAMYDKVELQRMIPVEFYRAIAEIINYLNQMQPRTRTPA